MTAMTNTHDLADFIRHVERNGPECVLEVAAGTLSDTDVGELRGFIDWKERTQRFKRGQWTERNQQQVRACESCGLDLPPGGRANQRYHKHCRSTESRRRSRARQAAGGS
jgi:hypothetical protein